ncbi:hypothetical protein Nepgr_028460 [Nepenthes gracilis]|uniref:Cytochrome P450 n=1 Tax=Nepenthes gracilis TaxID=150966 RepID=A0AAD3TC32_NEPGR|nr:hypothetical protein Nepgr_028460 [Nepenthes gracilis]
MEILSFMLWLLLPCLTLYLLFQLKRTKSSLRRLPPGPFPLPIFGNIFQLGDNPHRSLAKLAKTYGPLMTLQLGQITTVVISSPDMAKEIIQKNDLSFSNRFIPDSAHAFSHQEFSMPWLPVSTPWKNLRKISNSYLFSICRLDASRHLRQKKVEELLSFVQRSCKACVAVDIGKVTFETTFNLMSNILCSMDFVELGSNSSNEYKEIIRGIAEEYGKPNFADYFPILKILDPQKIRHRMTIHMEKIMNLFNIAIDKRLEAKNSCSANANDVLDALINIMQMNSQELERPYITHLMIDLLVAGTDTTSSTIEWAMTELLRNPDKLKKAQAELEEFIGRGNPVEEGNIATLSYLQSIVKETLRLHPPAPFLIPRKSAIDIELCGFTVPMNAQVLVNVWAIGRDVKFWENPNSFKPERFLESNINFKGQDFELIPFGAGRRICPGLPLAMRMLPVILGSLVHSFNWKLQNGNNPDSMDMEEKFGITLQKVAPLCAIPISK